MLETKIKSFDNKLLNIKEYNQVNNPKGIIQLIHGMGENSNDYEDLAKFYNKKGFIVFIQDIRAHGKNINTAKEMGKYEGDIFYDTVRDTIYFTKHLEEKYGLKVILIGHSFGAFVAKRCTQLYDKYQGLILSGTAQLKNNPGLYFGWMVANAGYIIKGKNTKARIINSLTTKRYNKKFSDNNWLTTDKLQQENHKKNKNKNIIFPYSFYKNFFQGIIDGNKNKNMEKCPADLPILIVAGKKDVINNDGFKVSQLKKHYKKNGFTTVKKIIYSKKRHSILNESNRREVYEDIYQFIENNILNKGEKK